MSARRANEAFTSGNASSAPLPSPRRRPRSRSGRRPSSARTSCVPRLRRAVRGDHALDRRRRQPGSDERGRAGHEAVEQHDAALGGRTEADAGQHGELEASHGREHGHGIPLVGRVGRQRTAHRLHLPCQPLVVEARAPPTDGLGLRRQQGRAQRRRGRRVADAHVAGGDDREPVGGELRRKLRAGDETRERLVTRHRRALRRVRCPGAEAELTGPPRARRGRRRRRPRPRGEPPSRARARSPPRRPRRSWRASAR